MSSGLSNSTLFLSTPSGWRATRFTSQSVKLYADFYPRPPGGGRLRYSPGRQTAPSFLSTPSGWRATGSNVPNNYRIEFLSTPSGWRATPKARGSPEAPRISIHALRVEGDKCTVFVFYRASGFLSTPSGWRATERRFLRSARYADFYPRPPGGGRLFS